MIGLYIISGFTGVANMILWGVYGDVLVEKFRLSAVLRSVFLGLFYSIFIYLADPGLPLLIVALLCISFERLTTEIYKAAFRKESQQKYKIPSDLNIKTDRALKFVTGLLLLVVVLYAFYFWDFQVNNLVIALFIGLPLAIGGMAKDAPYEGFDPVKFFRSPVVALFVGIILYLLYPNLDSKIFLFAVPGGERIISEFYKKIWNKKIPGKFKQSLTKNKKWAEQRNSLLYLYGLDIIVLIILALLPS